MSVKEGSFGGSIFLFNNLNKRVSSMPKVIYVASKVFKIVTWSRMMHCMYYLRLNCSFNQNSHHFCFCCRNINNCISFLRWSDDWMVLCKSSSESELSIKARSSVKSMVQCRNFLQAMLKGIFSEIVQNNGNITSHAWWRSMVGSAQIKYIQSVKMKF